MARRTKQQLEAASRLIKLYLIDTDNDPHNAYNEYIKFYLVSGQKLPGYVKGLKDFIKISKEYQKEYEYIQQLEQRKQDNKVLESDYAEKIKGLSKEQDYIKIKNAYNKAHINTGKHALCELMLLLHRKSLGNIEEYNNWKFNADSVRTFIIYGII